MRYNATHTKRKMSITEIFGFAVTFICGIISILFAVIAVFYLRFGAVPGDVSIQDSGNGGCFIAIRQQIASTEHIEDATHILGYTKKGPVLYQILCKAGSNVQDGGIDGDWIFGESWETRSGEKVSSEPGEWRGDPDDEIGKAIHEGYIPEGYVCVRNGNVIEIYRDSRCWGYAKEASFFACVGDAAANVWYCICYHANDILSAA